MNESRGELLNQERRQLLKDEHSKTGKIRLAGSEQILTGGYDSIDQVLRHSEKQDSDLLDIICSALCF